VAVKQILEDESMMNRETQILQAIGTHPNIIQLKQYFHSAQPAKTPQEIQEQQVVAPISPDKKFLNLVTDFMPITLSKYN